MPLGPEGFLLFDVDVFDQDVPLIFRLEHHRQLKFSSNKIENTFHHSSYGTIVPVSSVEEVMDMLVNFTSNGQWRRYSLQKWNSRSSIDILVTHRLIQLLDF